MVSDKLIINDNETNQDCDLDVDRLDEDFENMFSDCEVYY